jgi:dihydrofolate reductase
MAENRVIGHDNTLPWRLPKDMRNFMNVTMGKPVLMGRKTFESMKAPLPGRTNIVLTRDRNWHRPGIKVVHDVDAGLELAQRQARSDAQDEVMVIGGADVYALTLPRATRLYITHVHAEIPGEVRFPEFDLDTWKCVTEENFSADDKHTAPFTIAVYERP